MTNATTLWRGMPAGRNGKRKSRELVGREGESIAGLGRIATCPLLGTVLFQPFEAAHVGQVFYLEVLEGGAESVAVGAGTHHAHLNGGVVLQPGVAHEGVLLVVERVEYLDGVEASHGLDPDVGHGPVEGDDAPVGGVVGNHGAEVEFAVDELDAGLDVVFVVDAQHDAGLVESGLVVAGDFDFHFELTAVGGIVEGGVVDGEAVVRDAPVVGLGGYKHGEGFVFDFPLFGLVEPLHFF